MNTAEAPAARTRAPRCAPRSVARFTRSFAAVLTSACFALAAAPSIPTPHSTTGRRSCSLTSFAARAATSVLPLAPSGRSRDRTSHLPSLVAGGRRFARPPATPSRGALAGGEAASCQRDFRSLATRGRQRRPLGGARHRTRRSVVSLPVPGDHRRTPTTV